MLNGGGFINDIHIKNEDVLLILKKSRRISFKGTIDLFLSYV
ncbi:hypothetical protein RRG50_04415 [Mycoplasmopsis felis]|nr:hypothetical protein [Mycoplasmopsis felis]WQQ10980.1 hypothetical protein RRG45_00440 [Mycoplasmopsis felis]